MIAQTPIVAGALVMMFACPLNAAIRAILGQQSPNEQVVLTPQMFALRKLIAADCNAALRQKRVMGACNLSKFD
jgi:hypothetical protein